MNLNIYSDLANQYKNNSQKIRVLSEQWFVNSMYCPACLNKKINQFPNNSKVADFFCSNCNNKFELKSSYKFFGKKVIDGEYNTMINVIINNQTPNFYFLHYSNEDWFVKNMFVVPSFFFTKSIIEKRKKLYENAKRKGWVGCNILLDKISEDGKISIIKNEKIISKFKVNKKYNKLLFLNKKTVTSRGWTLDVLKSIQDLDKFKFTLLDLYSYKLQFKELHPENNNIEAKIRQQLQILRKNKIIYFDKPGHYHLIK